MRGRAGELVGSLLKLCWRFLLEVGVEVEVEVGKSAKVGKSAGSARA